MRVHRSFAFVDVSGFTALTETEGDEHAVEVLTAFRALLREICARRGVRIAKWLGDGVMLVCVETPPLLAGILELHHVVCTVSSPAQTVSIRSGVTSGDVILMEGDDYIGHCVNVAARLCDLAQAGEALASPSVMDHLPRWGVVVTHRDVALTRRGKTDHGLGDRDARPRRRRLAGPHLRRPALCGDRRSDGAGSPGPGGSLLLTRMPRYVGAPSPAPTQHRQRERSHGVMRDAN